MKINLDLNERSYTITVERGAISRANKLFDLDRRVLVVTDSGVPLEYSDTVMSCCKEAYRVILPMGEENKTVISYQKILEALLQNGFSRRDCVVAVGGGVTGDISGFAASTFMRGIDFYNVPTTLLSMLDSSVGGKTGIDFMGVKNIVGSFYQPKGVLIDPETLKTLPKRQFSNGLAEGIKIALTSSSELFDIFEKGDIEENLEKIIVRSVTLKKQVVEQDEKESGLRKILNFGHTFGHGIEASSGLSGLLHGECVALGMIPMCHEEIRPRVISVLEKAGLPTVIPKDVDIDSALRLAAHDKKRDQSGVSVIFVDSIGSWRMEKMSFEDFCLHIKNSQEI